MDFANPLMGYVNLMMYTMSNVPNVVQCKIMHQVLPKETHVTLHSLDTGMAGNHLVIQGLIVAASVSISSNSYPLHEQECKMLPLYYFKLC